MNAEAWRDGMMHGGLLVLFWFRDMPLPEALRLLEAIKRDPAMRSRVLADILARTPTEDAPSLVNCSPVATPEDAPSLVNKLQPDAPQGVTCSPVATPSRPSTETPPDGATMEAKRPRRKGGLLARVMGWTDGATMGQRWGSDI